MATSKSQGTDRTFQFSDPAAVAGIIVMVIAAVWIAWYFAHTQISALYVYVRYAEVWVLNLAGAFFNLPGISSAHNWVQRVCAPERTILLCTRDFSTLSWGEITSSSMVFNGLCVIILGGWCFRMFRQVSRTHPGFRFTKNHSIKSFVKENAALYPHLKLVERLDLVAKPLADPLFGMSLTSRQFAYKHRLISGWQKMADGQYVPVLNREAATAVFLAQLGPHWTRSADLTPGETLLLAIVLPRVAATDPRMDDAAFKNAMADSDGLIKWCWDHFTSSVERQGRKRESGDDGYAWLRPAFDLSYPRQIIARYLMHPEVKQIIEQHAFRRTILYACYVRASALGVFPPADVRWLRFYDRELWYLRSSIGRQVAFAEGGSAVYCHYLYEAKAGCAIVEPQLDKAVSGLEAAMHGFRYTEADKKAYEEARG
ncbi:type IV secretion protein [Bordetella flabilis]|uniref:Type IV secretion protein n=1 Tax=Bordetella flabilis TaxID=463014 RepID=A0A193GM06_9BORD|nr:type IV secretion protein [Bordetella flabilis]ANN80900.1 type IV secretion protein [Bordetella flabilis]